MAPQSKVNVLANNKKPSAPGSGAYAKHTRTLARSSWLPGFELEGSRDAVPIPVCEAPGKRRSATGTFSCDGRSAGVRGGVCCVETCLFFVSS
jgi:hypothetical protein